MNKVWKRLLTFGIGLPVMIAFCLFNYQHHLALNILGIVVSGICAFEFHRMFSNKIPMFNKWLLVILSALQPLASYLFVFFGFDPNLIAWVLIFEIVILMAIECFTAKTFEKSLYKISGATILLFYCSFMLTFITRLTALENPLVKNFSTHFIILFFIVVFLCDSAAWFFGILFGKGSRGLFAASPNKSIVGFIGGIVASIFFALMLQLAFPQSLGNITEDWWKMVIIGSVTAIAAIIGDLIESVFKRSCEVKDSGKIMFGRGGMLDSLDSLLVAGPVFYVLIFILYSTI